jgi:hypothetical protein
MTTGADARAACPARRHGTWLAYQVDRCRCPDARADQSRYRKQLRDAHRRNRHPRVPAAGTRRRIRALQAIGWPLPELMRRLGRSYSGNWLPYTDVVDAATADRVRRLYNELAFTSGPSQWTRTWAVNRGYLPPAAWDEHLIDDPAYQPPRPCSAAAPRRKTDIDWVIVERLVAGEPFDAAPTRAERQAAVRRLHTAGHGYHAIARHVHVNVRQVHRDLTDLGLVGAAA